MKKKKKKFGISDKILNKFEKIIKRNNKVIDTDTDIDIDGNEDKYDILFKKILVNTNNLWFPDKKNKLDDKISDNNGKNGTQYTSHSWFNITEYTSNLENSNYDAKISSPEVDELVKCQKIKMYPNQLQKELLLNWMKSYITMYNETLKIFKKFRFNKEKTLLNWKKLRTKYLKGIKNDIINKSQLEKGIPIIDNKPINTKVNGHILDFAIQDACSKLKSCITNVRNGNIKHFRMRYIKQTKKTMILKIEKNFINAKKNTFCSTIFKDSFKFQDNFQLKDINCDFIIQYNRKIDEFQLLNPIKIQQVNDNIQNNSCSLDPGIKTFLTLFSNNMCAKIGDNLKDKIIKYHYQIERMDRANKRERIKEKIRRKYHKKIENAIDDLHWKTINYLTKNFNCILIGNLGTKGIIKKKLNNELDKKTKIVAQYMSLYKFKQRLQYKCLQKKIGYKEEDEAYTTKACTRCGYKNEVGSKRHIKCDFCKLSIDRDFNGARNIMLRGTN